VLETIPAGLLIILVCILCLALLFLLVLGILLPYFVWQIHRSLLAIKEFTLKEVKLSRQLLVSYGHTPND